MSNSITRLAMLLASALFINTTAIAQPWTLAGPDDGNQSGNNYSFGEQVLASDKGNGFYLAFKEYAWTAPNYSDLRMTVRRWTGTDWQPVGPRFFSTGVPEFIDIAVAAGPKPYVVYKDYGVGRKAVVKTFNGTSWTDVGTPVSPGPSLSTSIAIDGSGTPYVAYVDSPASRKVSVKKWDGTAWQLLGTANFSQAQVDLVKIAIGNNGLPQVMAQFNNSIEVFRFTGSAWVSSGVQAAAGVWYDADMALKGDTAFIAYANNTNNHLCVSKFNGSSWVPVGPANFSPGSVDKIQLVIDTLKGTYVYCSSDPSGSTSATIPMVRRFDGANWVVVGPDSFVVREHGGNYVSFALDTAGTPYVSLQNYKHRLMKLTSGAWTPQGNTEGISNGPSLYMKVAAAPNGQKAYGMASDPYNNVFPYNSKVYRYDNNWTVIGQSGSGGLNGMVVDIAVHPDGEPWVVLRDSGTNNIHSIWRHTTTGWVYTGLRDTAYSVTMTFDGSAAYVAFRLPSYAGIEVHKYTSSGWVHFPVFGSMFGFEHVRIAINSAGVPYVLAGGHISTTPNYLYWFQVYKQNGASWTDISGTVNSANNTGHVGSPDLAIDTADVPYVVYPNSNQYQAKVQKFNAATSSWVDVVPTGSMPTKAWYPGIQFAPDGSLYLWYADGTLTPSPSLTVKRLSGSTWQTVGAASFAKTNVMYPSLALLNNRLLATFSDGAGYAYKYDCAQPAIVTTQPRDTIVCAGANLMFVAPGTGATFYRWQYNNGNNWVNLQNSAVYNGVADDTLQLTNIPASLDGTRFRCVLGNACNGTSLSDAALLRVDDVNWPAPSVTIAADKAVICAGSPVTFQASALNFGVLYAFEWSINGTPVAGATNPVFTTTTLAQGDAVTCKLTRSSACGLGPVSATSSAVSVVVNPTQSPTVSISPSPVVVITTGQSVTFTTNVTNGGPAPQYQWFVNGNPVQGETASTYTNSALANGFSVGVSVKRADSCALPNSTFSSVNIVQFPASVKDTRNANGWVIYPQPARDHITIANLDGIPEGNYMLRMYDIVGRVALEEKLAFGANTPTHKIMLPASIPAGTYKLVLSGTEKAGKAGKAAEAMVSIVR